MRDVVPQYKKQLKVLKQQLALAMKGLAHNKTKEANAIAASGNTKISPRGDASGLMMGDGNRIAEDDPLSDFKGEDLKLPQIKS